ncbi:MAG: 50S ribosomal protein L35 [Parcubacteria group bacterium CG08_land_8_20_14_0_20_43_9]|nr:MAG: 50S ribosomal protein L35 [Parcubacteria group bacterium CG08_land_8_20_14_0_20_43_9]
MPRKTQKKRKAKTKKSLAKRFKLTKSGKLLRKATGQNHFRSKKSGKLIREKRKWVELPDCEAKKIKKLMST